MRPAETLGMLEEAAGTRMYEDKKEKAKATIAKKQIKVDEINKVPRPPSRPASCTLSLRGIWGCRMAGSWVAAAKLWCNQDRAVTLPNLAEVSVNCRESRELQR